jgi:ribosomal protein L37AE/L43A
MKLHGTSPRKFPHAQPITECRQCGEQLFAPEWSEYVDERRIRHVWVCDACGYSFETEARFPRMLAR